MIEEQGIITEVKTLPDGQTGIAVQTAIKTTCGSCAAKANCSTSVIAQYFTPAAQALYFTTKQNVHVGQQVTLGIRENTLLKASFLIYILPLLVFILSFWLTQNILTNSAFDHELVTLSVALSTTFFAFVGVNRFVKQARHTFTPTLCQILPAQTQSSVHVVDVQTSSPKR